MKEYLRVQVSTHTLILIYECLPLDTHIIFLFREYESLVNKSDSLKERFTELESQDVKCREDLKHTKNKDGKLQKSIEQEKKHVRNIFEFFIFIYLFIFWSLWILSIQ